LAGTRLAAEQGHQTLAELMPGTEAPLLIDALALLQVAGDVAQHGALAAGQHDVVEGHPSLHALGDRIEAVARRLPRGWPDRRSALGGRRRLHTLENVVEGRTPEMNLPPRAIERGEHSLVGARARRGEALPVVTQCKACSPRVWRHQVEAEHPPALRQR